MGRLISLHVQYLKGFIWIPEQEITLVFTASIFQHGGLTEGETEAGLQSRPVATEDPVRGVSEKLTDVYHLPGVVPTASCAL